MASMEAILRWLRMWRHEHLIVDRAAVLQSVDENGQPGPRYSFMIVMSCGIATLGLLQNSVAVIIGAMLISPLMGPIVELGMSLAIFDLRSLRDALKTLAIGTAIALATAILIVLVSPLQEATPEILARTEPTLFDLLVAVFSGLAGAYATITRKGETIVGVAIATALMPPLAVVGFGIATGNGSIAGGALFLFMTNLLAIALSVTIMARWYRFGSQDTPQQTAWQASMIIGTFILLSVPLGLALREIAARGVADRTVRNTLDEAARNAGGRITTLRVERSDKTVLVDAVLLTPKIQPGLNLTLEKQLEGSLGRPVVVELREVLTADDQALASEQATIAQLRDSVQRLQTAAERDAQNRLAGTAAIENLHERALAHFGKLETLQDGKHASWRLDADSGLDIRGAHALERALDGDDTAILVEVVPALQALPLVRFGDDSAVPDADNARLLDDIGWALARWEVGTVQVEGFAGGDTALAQARAQAVADSLARQGIRIDRITAVPATQARDEAAHEGVRVLRAARVRLETP
ncbi:DUF389 domain-containing protein [Pseudoxanthomonas kalamensis]|uniref:DUF389 domain-containing protein n=1 Tax=Pseudoxanthomonas kalamensis TaxID=289483 RepID=UPI0013913CEF|nr:DUF389 domain-containing protein [Pseudoxanthomonas kalamensis]